MGTITLLWQSWFFTSSTMKFPCCLRRYGMILPNGTLPWRIGSPPTNAFIIYPDRKSYIGIEVCDWLEDEKLYVYVSQDEEVKAFTEFFLKQFQKK